MGLPGKSSLFKVLLFLPCLLILRISQAEICYKPVCYFTLEIDRLQNLVWTDPNSGRVFDVDYVDGDWQVVATPARPSFRFGSIIGTSVNPRNIITADGFRRTIITVNGLFPGPTLEVGYPSEIVVEVVNKLADEAITIHWHGQDQRGTPWMDGTDFVTQCPIGPMTSFTYRFRPDPPGTFWYHTHTASQLADGIKGMFIIHAQPPAIPYFPVLVSDWFHYESHRIQATYLAGGRGSGGQVWTLTSPRLVDGTGEGIIAWNSAVINGRGRLTEADTFLPLTEFEVVGGERYLFRVANGAQGFAFDVSVDSHKIAVVALDGIDVDPQIVDACVIPVGGRCDFEVIADQPVNNYWMRARNVKDSIADPTPLEVKSIVRYAGAPANVDPTSLYRTCTAANRCSVIGCTYLRYPVAYYTDCINRAQMTHTYQPRERESYGLHKTYPDVELFLNARGSGGFSFNKYQFILPTAPLYQTDSFSEPCSECPGEEPCDCTYTLHIEKDKVVQIVVSAINIEGGNSAHPIHFHGHHFALLKAEYTDYTDYTPGSPAVLGPPTQNITCTDGATCRKAMWTSGRQPSDLNLQNPPLFDTYTVPAQGYFVMRFVSDNPGPWMLHCHLLDHSFALAHMKVILAIGRYYYPPVPPQFPTCQAKFALEDRTFRKYYQDSLTAIREGGKFTQIQVPHIEDFEYESEEDEEENDKDDNRDIVLNTGEFVGWIFVGVLIGFLLCATLTVLIACVCTKHCRMRQHQGLSSTNKIQPVYSNGHRFMFGQSLPSLNGM